MNVKQEAISVDKILLVTTQHISRTSDPAVVEDTTFVSSVLLTVDSPIDIDSSFAIDLNSESEKTNFTRKEISSVLLHPTYSKKIESKQIDNLPVLAKNLNSTILQKEIEFLRRKEIYVRKELHEKHLERKDLQERQKNLKKQLSTAHQKKRVFVAKLKSRSPPSSEEAPSPPSLK